MNRNKYGTILKKIINSIHQNYQENELAYLALTSKTENPLRDKIAFELHKILGKDKIICREWTNYKKSKTKADIAILHSNGKPECIIEFKAHSSISGIGKWSSSLINDIDKNKKLYSKTEMIFVLFANFVNKLPEQEVYKNAIKYYDNIAKSVKKEYSLEDQKEAWVKSLKNKNIKSELTNFVIEGGKYEDVNVQINTFIHENIFHQE